MSNLEELKPMFLTVAQTARELQVSHSHVYDLMREGALPFVRVGAVRRVPREALERLVIAASVAK